MEKPTLFTEETCFEGQGEESLDTALDSVDSFPLADLPLYDPGLIYYQRYGYGGSLPSLPLWGESADQTGPAEFYEAIPSPLNSSLTLDQPDGLLGHLFMDTIKAAIATLLPIVLAEQLKEDCWGCQTDHPSQKQHACLEPVPEFYMYCKFKELMKKVWNDRFVSGLLRLLESIGIVASASRVQGVCEGYLYELRNTAEIQDKINETLSELVGEEKKKQDLMNDFLTYWMYEPSGEEEDLDVVKTS